MALSDNSNTNQNFLSTDIYKITNFIDKLKAKYIDVPEETIYLGIYGYLSSIFSNLIQNTAMMVNDYANEAVPTKAKFEKNIISHALALGINNIFAIPAEIDVFLAFSESALKSNMTSANTLNYTDNTFSKIIIDRDAVFYIGADKQYPYMLDYDLIIKKIASSDNSSYSYTAQYDMSNGIINPLSNIINPYLPTLGRIKIDNENLISLRLTLRQMYHSTILKDIIVDNPFESKTLTFEFEDQLAYFYVLVKDKNISSDDSEIYLEPVYEGLSDYSSNNKFINYMFIDEKTIRLKFNNNSYFPKNNVTVTVHIYTTLGAKCNFSLTNTYQTIQNLVSPNYSYNALYYVLRSTSDSQYGRDRYSIEKLKQYIPKETLSRGSITTYTDLNNYFNTIQTDDCKLYLLEKIHNQIERIFYCYLLMKDGENIIPTNTINIQLRKKDFYSSSQNNFIILPNQPLALTFDSTDNFAKKSSVYPIYNNILNEENKAFLYTNPLMIVINKNPFYVSYFNIDVNYTRQLYFEYVNEQSLLQFIAMQFKTYKSTNPVTNEGEIHIELEFSQNIDVDFDLITYSSYSKNNTIEDFEIEDCLVSVYALLYYPTNEQGDTVKPFRYIEGTVKSYDSNSGVYTFDFCLKTNYRLANKNTYMYFNDGLRVFNTIEINNTGGKDIIPEGEVTPSYLYRNMKLKFFFMVKLDKKYGSIYYNEENNLEDICDYIPDISDYTLTNIYTAGDLGLDLFYNYSDIMNSYIELDKDNDTQELLFNIYRVPVVRYSWWNNIQKGETIDLNEQNQKQIDFFKILDYRRKYIENALIFLENSFGIDFKFYNTYGKSYTYNISDTNNIDRVNISLKFEVKFITKEDQVMLPSITTTIKQYIENIDRVEDLHIPNLVTEIKNKYESNLVYIKFIELNNYSELYQSIYKNPELTQDKFADSQLVPEFININTNIDSSIDISYKII